NWAGSLFEKKINGRGFAFTFLLHTQTHPWLFKRYFRHYRHGTIGATTGNNNDLLDAHGWALLIKYSTQRTRNIGFFVVGHNAYTTTNIFVTFLSTFLQLFQLNFVPDLRSHERH